MAAEQIIPGLYQVPLGVVNAFIIAADDGLTLIDTGTEGSAEAITEAITKIGHQPEDVQHIIVTHCHADHSGSVAALKVLTNAQAYMHPVDAALVREGKAARNFEPGPGLIPRMIYTLMRVGNTPTTVAAAPIEHEINDGDDLNIAGGLHVIHTPGHCAGQVALLWQGRVMFAADAASNVMGRLGPTIVYEDVDEGLRSAKSLSTYDFEMACFGHGRTITSGASQKFKQVFG